MAYTLDGEVTVRIECTYPDCIKSFPTRKHMISHKLDDPEHNYCKKCNVDCGDWEDFTQHKVEAMAPFLEGAMNGTDIAPKHIVCEFCGEDFKSFGGRKIHRRQRHQADQSITCPGCSAIFVRAAMMIGHIERGHCLQIRPGEFIAHIQHKFILKEIMEAPDVFAQNLQINKAFAPASENPGLITDGSVAGETETDTQTETDGGVTLLDQDAGAQKIKMKPLQAAMNLIDLEDKKAPLTIKNLQQSWPRLPGDKIAKRGDVKEYLRNVSVGSPPPSSVNGSEMSASQFASEITSRRGGHKVRTASYTGIRSPDMASSAASSCSDTYDSDADDSDKASVSTARPEAVLARPPAWTTRNTTQALFAKARPTPPTAAELLRREEEQAAATPNLFTARFWDPVSKDYNSDRFFHTVLQKYCCPFPDCQVEPSDDVHTLEGHLLEAHARIKFRCAACLKVFRKAEGLVAHCESQGNCPIQKHDAFFKMLDEMTGGFLKAKTLPQPLIYRPENAVTKAGKPVMDGVMSTLYKGKMPHER